MSSFFPACLNVLRSSAIRGLVRLAAAAGCLAAAESRLGAAGVWRSLAHQPPEGVDTLLLLTDGSVLAHSSGNTERWFLLAPDNQGHYTAGTWSAAAPMHDTRLYFASQVLTNGNVFVAGGEYGSGGRRAEVFDPQANTWTPAPIQGGDFVDAISEMLPDGGVLVAPVGPSTSGGTVIFRPESNSWLNGPKLAHGGYQDEASWVKLPDDSILTIDPFGTNTERYIPGLNQWRVDAPAPAPVYSGKGEMGPAFLLPDGRAFFIGGNGTTLLYAPSGSTLRGAWTVGPPIPMGLGVEDGPGAMMVNGKILFAAGSAASYSGPSHFFEYDPAANSMTQVNGPTGPTLGSAPYVLAMLDLPDGTVLMSTAGQQLYAYQPDGAPLASGKPSLAGLTNLSDGSWRVTGTGLNGISEGAAYGDDAQMSSNYPLLAFADGGGRISYARTIRRTSTSVRTGAAEMTADFVLPGGLAGGSYAVTAIANGIASDPVTVTVPATPPPAPRGVMVSSATASRVQLKWNVPGGLETGWRIDRGSDGATYAPVGAVGAAPGAFSDSKVAPLTRYYYRVVATNATGAGDLGGVCFGATPGSPGLPAPWAAQDVGFVAGPGAAGAAAGVFTVLGSGRAFADPRDQFQFVSQKAVGDATWTARVASMDAAVSNTAAGLMFRSSQDPGAPFVALTVGPSGAPVFQSRRLATRGVDLAWAAPYTGPATWLRLTRRGDAFTAYASPDGAVWTRLGTVVTPMPRSAYAGLAVTSGDERRLARAAFDAVTASVPPWYQVVLAGASALTNECHAAFADPGAAARALAGRIAGGGSSALAVRRGGAPAAWGDTLSGQGAPPATAANLTGVAAGLNFALGVRTDGRVFGWGDNSFGQTMAPTAAAFQAVAAGNYHALGLKTDGTVQQWGGTNRSQGTPPTNMDAIVSISAGGAHSLAMSTAGKLYAWGYNGYGQTTLPSLSGAVGIAAGGLHSLAVTAAGTVQGWGDNRFRQAAAPAGLSRAVAVAAGLRHSLALRADGSVVAWGDNSRGQTSVPPGLGDVVAVAAGDYFSLALREDGTIAVWGDNGAGEGDPGPALAAPAVGVAAASNVDTNAPGTYAVTYTAADGAGGVASASRTVVVSDTTPPTLALRDLNPLPVLAGAPFADPGADAVDACAGDVSSAVEVGGAVDVSTPGSYLLTYSATDPSGNRAEITRTVQVVAAVPPPSVSAAASGRGIRLEFEGVLGARYSAWESPDPTLPFSAWKPLGEAVRANDGRFEFTDPAAGGPGARFYRIQGP